MDINIVFDSVKKETELLPLLDLLAEKVCWKFMEKSDHVLGMHIIRKVLPLLPVPKYSSNDACLKLGEMFCTKKVNKYEVDDKKKEEDEKKKKEEDEKKKKLDESKWKNVEYGNDLKLKAESEEKQKKEKKESRLDNRLERKVDSNKWSNMRSVKDIINSPGSDIHDLFSMLLFNIDDITNVIVKELTTPQNNNNNNELKVDGVGDIDKFVENSKTFETLIKSTTFKKFYIFLMSICKLLNDHEIYFDPTVIPQNKLDAIDKYVNKTYENDKEKIPRVKEMMLANMKREAMMKHVEQLIYISYNTMLVFSNLLRPTGTMKNIVYSPIILVDDMLEVMNNMEIDRLYNRCIKINNFKLNLQVFLVKNGIDAVDIYMYNYQNRKNPLINIIFGEIDERYIHLLWNIFEARFPYIYSKINNVNSPIFIEYLNRSVNKIKDCTKRKQDVFLDRFESLILIYMTSIWMEHVIGVEKWLIDNVVLDINAPGDNFNLKYLSTTYPILVRLYGNIWGVVDDNIACIGSCIDALIYYRKKIIRKFEGTMHRNKKVLEKMDVTDLLLFKN